MNPDKDLIIRNGDAGKLAKRLGYSAQRVQNWKKRGIPAAAKLRFPEIFLAVASGEARVSVNPDSED